MTLGSGIRGMGAPSLPVPRPARTRCALHDAALGFSRDRWRSTLFSVSMFPRLPHAATPGLAPGRGNAVDG